MPPFAKPQPLPEIDGGRKELLTPDELPENASTMDVKTIKNAIKKRIPGSDESCMVVRPFKDAIGIGVAVDICGRMVGFSEPAPIGFSHKDLMNVIDRIESAIKQKTAEIKLGRVGFVRATEH